MKKIITMILMMSSFNLFAGPFAKPSEPHGILKLQQSKPSKDIFAVNVYEINGENIVSRDTGMWLKPGKHVIKMSAVVPLDQLSHSVSRAVKSNSVRNNSLEVNVEEGKVYYIGYDASERDPKQWKPVIWKIKDL